MEEGENKRGHSDLNSAIKAANKYADRVEKIETELEQEVEDLLGQVRELQSQLDNQPDCKESDDGDSSFDDNRPSEAQLAGSGGITHE